MYCKLVLILSFLKVFQRGDILDDRITTDILCGGNWKPAWCLDSNNRVVPPFDTEDNDAIRAMASYIYERNFTDEEWKNHEWYKKFIPWTRRWPGGIP